ncbi:MAG TPA: PDZ domain-containing protein, partial [Bacillota bacterium]|nr:PDZ domain-containing protein [Bacillota bacterium]
KAGLRKGDIIVEMADRKVATMQELNNVKKGYKAGDTVNVVVVRNRKNRVNLSLTFSEEK